MTLKNFLLTDSFDRSIGGLWEAHYSEILFQMIHISTDLQRYSTVICLPRKALFIGLHQFRSPLICFLEVAFVSSHIGQRNSGALKWSSKQSSNYTVFSLLSLFQAFYQNSASHFCRLFAFYISFSNSKWEMNSPHHRNMCHKFQKQGDFGLLLEPSMGKFQPRTCVLYGYGTERHQNRRSEKRETSINFLLID